MALSALQCSPDLTGVGQQVACVPVGTQDGSELRFYLASAPPGSALVTLANYASRGLQLADARLKVNAAGQGVFTPDVPGQYRPLVRDVTIYSFIPHYEGHHPAIAPSPEATTLDNELAALPEYAGAVPQAVDLPPGGVLLPVYQSLSRQIGFGQDTATLALRVYSNGVADSSRVPTPVTLTPGPTAPARLAVYNARVLQVLGRLEEGTEANLARHQQLLGRLVLAFNEHIGLQTWKVHGISDDDNALASTAAVAASLPAIATRLTGLASAYNAHRILVSGVHPIADHVASHVMPVLSCTTLEEAITWVEACYSALLAHATDTSSHDTSTEQSFADGYFGWLVEPPTTLAEVADQINGAGRWSNYGLTQLYESHRQRTTITAHTTAGDYGPDETNSVRFLGGSLANLITTANALAGALARHVQNLDASSAAASLPYHHLDARRSRLPQKQASDIRTLAQLIEELWLCLESHMWSAGPTSGYTTQTGTTRGQHPDRVFGATALLEAPDARPLLLIRLQKTFDAALSPDAPVPDGVGTLPGVLQLRAGFA